MRTRERMMFINRGHDLGEKSWILQLGKVARTPRGGSRPPEPTRYDFFFFGFFLSAGGVLGSVSGALDGLNLSVSSR